MPAGIGSLHRRWGAIMFFIAFFILVGILKGSVFLTWDNFMLIASQNANVAFAAVGLTFALIAGQFDLSVGALMGLCALLIAGFTAKQGMPLALAIVLIVCIGAIAGVLNGLLVTRLQINAFIATLGTGSIFTGLAFLYNGPNVIFEGISPDLISVTTTKVAGITVNVFYVVALLVVAWALSKQTMVGRFFEAIGANPEAARLAGVRVERYTVWAFVAAAVTVSLAGIVTTGTFGSADPNQGPAVLLPAFAAAFLGTALTGNGRFTVIGTLLATFLVAWSKNGLEVLGLNVGVKSIFDGAVLISAVAVRVVFHTRRTRTRSATA